MNNILSFPGNIQTFRDYAHATPPSPYFEVTSQIPPSQHYEPWLIHLFAAKVFTLPASRKPQIEVADDPRFRSLLDSGWKVRRVGIKVDNYVIDATLIGRPTTLNNRRWTLISSGNADQSRRLLLSHSPILRCLDLINTNAILFDYPGVGASSGYPSRSGMIKAYDAALSFAEQVLKAEQIICYAFSISGAIQNEALRTHALDPAIKYVLIKDRSFSHLSAAANSLYFWPCNILIWIVGWNLGAPEVSNDLKNEIIIQSEGHDGYISPQSSLAARVSKEVIYIPQRHLEPLTCKRMIGSKVEALLAEE